MSKPDPVKNKTNHPINMSITHNNNSQPLYMLNNTIHPILDGVDVGQQQQQQHGTRMQQHGRSNSSQNNQNNEITIQRGWNSTILRSNSEFINGTTTQHDNNKYSYHPETHTSMSSNIKDSDDTNNNHKVGGEGVNIKVKHEESSSSDKELNNLSDDENQEEFDEAATEIPTLDTYVPREPSYDVANALPFKELCRRYVYSLFDYIIVSYQIILGKSSDYFLMPCIPYITYSMNHFLLFIIF